MNDPREQLEFSISQYLDGTLPPERRPAVEALLAEDETARQLLAEHRAVTELLRSAPLPEIRWDALAGAISSAIDSELQRRVDHASGWLRLRVPAALAAAACVLLAAAIAIHLALANRSPANRGTAPQQANVLVVQGPSEDRPAGPVVAQISIGPGASLAKDSSAAAYADEIDTQPARVLIASGASPQPQVAAFPF